MVWEREVVRVFDLVRVMVADAVVEGEEPGALKGAARGVMQFCPGGGANLDLDLVARLLPKEVLTIIFNIVSSRLAACGQPA